MEVMTPEKIANCNENTSPTTKVTANAKASDRVARATVLICRNLTNDNPIKITKVANEQRGTNRTKSLSKNTPTRIIRPVKRLAILDLAPLATLRVERVRDPDAGIPEKMEHPRLPIPIEKVSWLVSIRPPALADNDFLLKGPQVNKEDTLPGMWKESADREL